MIRAVASAAVSSTPLDLRYAAGVDTSGATDSTAGFLSAINNNAAVLVPRNCTILLNTVSLPSTISIFGEGPTSVLKHKNSATDHMLFQNHAGAYLQLNNLTLDGNYQNNGGDGAANQSKGTLRLYAGGASATQPTIVDIDGVTFINGGVWDCSTNYTQPSGPTYWMERNTRHLGGADGCAFGGFNGAVNAFLDNILFDPQRLPTGSTGVGRCGYIFYLNNAADTTYNSVTANNIQAYRTGIGVNNGTLGAIDSYNGGDCFLLTNSFSKQAVGRGFTTKTDTRRMIFSNVTVSDLQYNSSNSNGVVGAAIGLNSGTITSVGADLLIDGVIVYNSQGEGIVLHAPNVLGSPSAVFKKALITNFMIDTVASGKQAIGVIDGANLKISNGTILNSDTPLTVDSDTAIPPYGPVTITNVDIDSTGKPTITANAKANSGVWYARNRQGSAWSVSDLTLTVASNAITVWNPCVIVDTSGGAQSVSTISGVPDNEEITVQTNSASHSLSLTSGGNINIGSTLTISDTTTVYRFKSVAGSLYRVQ